MINRYIFLIVATTTLIFAKPNTYSEDEAIVKALYYSENSNPKSAAKEWKLLFDKTNNEKYLVEYFYASLAYKDIKDVIKELKTTLQKKNNKELYELLASLYTKEGDTNELLDALKQMSPNDTDTMYELAYLYTIQGKEDKALKLYKQIYKQSKSWNALKGILSILANKKKIKEASDILWKAISKKDNKLPKDAYLVYAGLVDYKQNSSKLIYVFKKLLLLTKDKQYIKQLISLYLYKKDYNSIIELLELTHYDEKLLYELYLSKHKLVKAYKLLDNLYKSTKEPKWLAEKAILTYEIAQKYNAIDRDVTDEVSKLFDKSIALGEKNSTYLNYYGYTLIDHNIDIKKGINLVKEALKAEPNNVYYLDSLAWGLYKLGSCKEANEIFKKIKSIDPKSISGEMLEHNNKILNCKDK